MKETNWLKDCELCNAGVCKRIDELKEQGLGLPPIFLMMKLWNVRKQLRNSVFLNGWPG